MAKVAYLYPGQGAQYSGMCRPFYEAEASVRSYFAEASEVLGYDLAELIFAEDGRIDDTRYTQPAMVTMELALTPFADEALRGKGFAPAYSAGLSLGEYAAIAEAGAFGFRDAVSTVARRGALMADAVPAGEGAMAAVLGAEAALVEHVTGNIEGAWVANYNCPGQIVITGRKAAVDEACAKLSAAGVKRCVPLKVSGPFHSPLLKEAGTALYDVLKAVRWQPLTHPYIANADAKAVSDPSEIADSLRRQVSSSVLWEQSVKEMLKDGVDTFIEIGPGKTLTGFMRKITKAYAEETGADVSGVKTLRLETPDDFNALCKAEL